MAKKKQVTYNDVIRNIAEMEKLAEVKRQRMAGIMAEAMDGRTAELLGDLNDTDLRRVAVRMYARADECLEQIMSEKRRQEQAKGGTQGNAG